MLSKLFFSSSFDTVDFYRIDFLVVISILLCLFGFCVFFSLSTFMIIKPTIHIQKFVNLWDSCIGFCTHKPMLSFRQHKTYSYMYFENKNNTRLKTHWTNERVNGKTKRNKLKKSAYTHNGKQQQQKKSPQNG